MINFLEELARFVPPSQRDSYWRFIAYLRKLNQDDEILLIVWGMALYSTMIRDVPVSLFLATREVKKSVKIMASICRDLKMTLSSSAAIFRSSRRDLPTGGLSAAELSVILDQHERQILAACQDLLGEHLRATRRMIWQAFVGLAALLVFLVAAVLILAR